MRNCRTIRLTVAGAAAMRRLGRALGERVGAGTLICLYGDLGAGKTTLTQGIAQGLGIAAREIASASFVLCAEHHDGRLPLYHVDLYRLESSDVEASGLVEYFFPDGVTVVEWADRAAGLLPRTRIDVTIVIRGGFRELTLVVPARFETLAEILVSMAPGVALVAP